MLLAIGLTRKPREVPSPLIGQPVPAFDLPPVTGRTLGLASADLGRGEVSLVNVFASWCVACREEHPVLIDLKARGAVALMRNCRFDARSPADRTRRRPDSMTDERKAPGRMTVLESPRPDAGD